MSVNPDSIPPGSEFSSKVPPAEPLTTKGHAPGVKVGNDAKPEFNLETYPPGTAPGSRSFEPQTQNEVPGQAFNPAMEGRTKASDTIPGATSADVHTGYGRPNEGQTNAKREGAGLEGVGASLTDPIHEHGFDRPYETGAAGHSGDPSSIIPAENQVPVSAEEIASERR